MTKKHQNRTNNKVVSSRKVFSKTLSKSYIKNYFGLSTENFPFKIIEISDGEGGVDIYPAAIHMGAAGHINLLTGENMPSAFPPCSCWMVNLKSYDAEVSYHPKDNEFVFKAKKANLVFHVNAATLEKRFGKGIVKKHIFFK